MNSIDGSTSSRKLPLSVSVGVSVGVAAEILGNIFGRRHRSLGRHRLMVIATALGI